MVLIGCDTSTVNYRSNDINWQELPYFSHCVWSEMRQTVSLLATVFSTLDRAKIDAIRHVFMMWTPRCYDH